MSLDWFLIQHGFFKLAHHDSTKSKWRVLNGLIRIGSELLEIRGPVIGAFYNTYGSTGTFILNRQMGRPSGEDYFMVMADADFHTANSLSRISLKSFCLFSYTCILFMLFTVRII